MNSLVNSIAAVGVTAALSVGNLSAREFPLSDLTFSTMPGVGSSPVVAASSTGALALWSEPNSGIWAAPLDLQGRLRSVYAFAITQSGTVADLVWNGSSYFMVWNTGNFLSSPLHVSEVSEDGRVLRGKTIDVPIGAAAMAWNGTNLLIVGGTQWSAPRPGFHAITLDRDLTLVRQVQVSPNAPFSVALASAGGKFFLATAWYPGMNGYWFSGDGQLENEFVIEASQGTSAGAYRPQNVAAASDSETVVVAWTAAAYGTNTDVKAATVLPSGGIGPVRQLSPGGRVSALDVELQWNGREYALVFLAGLFRGQTGDYLELVAVRLGRDAQSLDPQPHVITPVSARANFRDFVFAGDHYIAGIREQTALGSGNVSIAFDQHFRLQHREVVSRAATFQAYPAVATDGAEFLSVWVERTAQTNSIYAGRITRHGERLDGRGILIIETEGLFYFPRVAFGGGVYLIVWHSGTVFLGARLSQQGALLDQQPFVIDPVSSVSGVPGIGWNGENFLVAALREGRIAGTLVSPSGVVQPTRLISPPTPIPGAYWQVLHSSPELAWNGRHFVLSYEIIRMPPCFFPSCSGARTPAVVALSRDGDPLGEPVELRGGGSAHVASSGDEFLVTFTADWRLWSAVLRVVNGQVIAGQSLFLARNTFGRPLWDGSAYRVYFATLDEEGKSRLAFRRVDRGGNVLGDIFRLEEYRSLHDIARTAGGEILGVFVRQDPAAPLLGVPRVFGWFLHEEPVQIIPTRQRGVR